MPIVSLAMLNAAAPVFHSNDKIVSGYPNLCIQVLVNGGQLAGSTDLIQFDDKLHDGFLQIVPSTNQ